MARYWGGSGDNYLRYAGVSVSGYPLTMAAWVRPNNSTVNQTVMGVFGDNDAFYLALDLSAAGDPVRAVSWSTGTGFAVSERTGVTTGDWQHIGAEFAGSTSRTARLAGVAGTTNTTASTVTFGNLTRTTLGRFDRGTPTSQLVDCSQAYGAMWATTLTDAEWAALAAGLHPVCVRPSALLHVWDLDGNRDPEPDRRGLASLTVFGTLSADAYPRIIYPRGRSMVALGSAGGGPVILSGTSATASWTASTAALQTRVALSGDSGIASWTLPLGSFTISGQVILSGDSAIASWTVPTGSLTTRLLLSGASATASWTSPTGTLASRLALSGASGIAAWQAAAGSLTTVSGGVTLTGDSASTSWALPSATLVLRVGLSGASGESAWTVGLGAFTRTPAADPGAQTRLWLAASTSNDLSQALHPADGRVLRPLSKRLHPKGSDL